MELSLHNALCKEIETLRIDDDTPSADDHGRTTSCNWLHHSRSPRMHTFSARTDTLDEAKLADEKARIPRQRTQRKRIVKQRSSSLYVQGTNHLKGNSVDGNDEDDAIKAAEDKAVMTGWLYKTTRLKTSKTRGQRQHRKFKLTTHSLEYSNLLQKVQLCVIHINCIKH